MKTDCEHTPHPCHTDELPRINRIAGQVQGVKKMVEEHRYCPDILIQIRAIRSALKSLEANILERHLNHCLTESLSGGAPDDIKRKLDELKDILKKYND